MSLGTTPPEVLGTVALLSIPAVIWGLLAFRFIGGIRSRNTQLCWFLVPLLIDATIIIAAVFWSGPSTDNAMHDHVNEGPISTFGLLELPALIAFVLLARKTIWTALALAAVGLLNWMIVMFQALNIMTDGRAVL